MAISIPAILDTELAAAKATLLPVTDAVTHTSSQPSVPYLNGNRAADLLRLLTGLIDSAALTGIGIHGAADAANPEATANAIDPATGYALSISLKGKYNAHRILTAGGVHGSADATNVVTAADADDEAKLVTLTNDLRTQYIAHIIKVTGSPATHGLADTVDSLTLAACTNYATAYALLNQIKTQYNLHLANINAGTTASVKGGTFTGVNSQVGNKATFTGNVTTALAGKSATIVSNTTSALVFQDGGLPAVPQTGDTFVVEFAAIDADIAVLAGGKGSGDRCCDPYASGPSFINAVTKLLQLLGVALPTYLTRTTDGVTKQTTYDPAEPFHIGSPLAGAGSQGHGGGYLIADALQQARDAVAAYTKPV